MKYSLLVLTTIYTSLPIFAAEQDDQPQEFFDEEWGKFCEDAQGVTRAHIEICKTLNYLTQKQRSLLQKEHAAEQAFALLRTAYNAPTVSSEDKGQILEIITFYQQFQGFFQNVGDWGAFLKAYQ
jgi:hypothetical protein